MKTEKDLKEIITSHDNNYYKVLFEEEGITKEDLKLVDLRWFSPVIPFKGGRPVEVTETIGGHYIVPGYPAHSVPKEMLTIMRYRYLANRR